MDDFLPKNVNNKSSLSTLYCCSFIYQSRTELEQQSIETANTSEAVGFITYVQSLKRKMKNWDNQVEVHMASITLKIESHLNVQYNQR